MAAAAAEQALQGIDKDSIGLVVVATITPDNITPSMAAMVKKELGLERAIAFDINAAWIRIRALDRRVTHEYSTFSV